MEYLMVEYTILCSDTDSDPAETGQSDTFEQTMFRRCLNSIGMSSGMVD